MMQPDRIFKVAADRVVEIGADRYGNGFLRYVGGRVEMFANLALDAPPEALGAGAGLEEGTLVQLALAGALPPLRIPADDSGRWSRAEGAILDCFIYRQAIAAWWSKIHAAASPPGAR